jgi:predicted esterase
VRPTPEWGEASPRRPSLSESQLAVSRTARYVTAGPPAADASAVWFALHGYGQLARRFARQLRPLLDEQRLVVVPEALSRFYLEGGQGRVGASWMTREDREAEISDYVCYLDQLLGVVAPPERVPTAVLGFSQGVATACRWSLAGRVRPQWLVLWAGGLPPDLPWPTAAKRLRDTTVVFVNGRNDPQLTRTEVTKQRDLLRARDVASEELWFDGGHELNEGVLADLATW